MNFHIETSRLILRELMHSDLDGLHELESNPIVHKYLGNQPVQDKNKLAEVIDFVRNQYTERGIGRWAVINKNTGEFMGWSGIKLETEPTNGFENYYDIGYRFIPRFWNKGYATESAMAALEYGFKNLPIHTLYGAAHVENIGSNRVLTKLGLRFVNQFNYDKEHHNWYKIEKSRYAGLRLRSA
ncbi:MAG: GNAT family N-acetyltransferase [Flavobacteriales bacterium]|nr:GNAT family N-acetyltransferase [Flavobacteriales bacterium]